MVDDYAYVSLMCNTIWISQHWTLGHPVNDDATRFSDLKELMARIVSIFTSRKDAVLTQVII